MKGYSLAQRGLACDDRTYSETLLPCSWMPARHIPVPAMVPGPCDRLAVETWVHTITRRVDISTDL